MTIARVNTAQVGTNAPAVSSQATGTFVATAGNVIAVFIRIYNTNTVSSVTDTAGNTYTQRAAGPNFDPSLWIFTAENITGHATNAITVTLGASIAFWWVFAVQYSGVATSGSTDIASSGINGTASDLVSNAFTTAQATEVVLVAVGQNTFLNYTAGTDFTLIDGTIPDSGSPNFFGGVEEYITPSILTSYTAHFTSSGSAPYNMAVLTLKGGSAPSANFFPAMVMGRPQSLVL